MSAVEFHFPPNKLAAKLRAAGGKPIAEALKEAQAGLDAIAPACLIAIDEVMIEIASAHSALPEVFNADALRRLYAAACYRSLGSSRCVAGQTVLVELQQTA